MKEEVYRRPWQELYRRHIKSRKETSDMSRVEKRTGYNRRKALLSCSCRQPVETGINDFDAHVQQVTSGRLGQVASGVPSRVINNATAVQ